MDHSILDLAASAAAVLLFLFAARSFVVGSNREPLGWGFGLAAGAILAYLIKDQIGGFGNGLKLGLGVILILPAFRALVDPKGTSIVTAVIGLVLAFAVAGKPVRMLLGSWGPPTPEAQLADLRTELETLVEQKVRAKNIIDDLVVKREDLARELRQLDLSDEEYLKHPRMSLLASVLEAHEKWENALVVIDKEIQAKSLRAQALEAGIEIESIAEDNPELANTLKDLDPIPKNPDDLGIIERAQLREKWLEIIERELK